MINNLMQYWWDHLPEKNTSGIVPKLINDERTAFVASYDSKSTGAGLGTLINSRYTNICIEGIVNPEEIVPFIELYSLEGIKMPFWSDLKNDIPDYLHKKRINSDRFFLHIYGSNDYETYGKVIRDHSMLDLVVLSDTKNKLYGLLSVSRNPGISFKRKVYAIQRENYLKMADNKLINRAMNSLDAILD